MFIYLIFCLYSPCLFRGRSSDICNMDKKTAERILDEDKAWLGILDSSIREVRAAGRNILAYGFYEHVHNNFTGETLFVPFLILEDCDYDVRELEKTVLRGGVPVSFHGDFLELGDWSKIKGKASRDRLALSKKYKDKKMGEIICVGERMNDGFYQGFWGRRDGDWMGNFKAAFEIDCPYDF